MTSGGAQGEAPGDWPAELPGDWPHEQDQAERPLVVG